MREAVAGTNARRRQQRRMVGPTSPIPAPASPHGTIRGAGELFSSIRSSSESSLQLRRVSSVCFGHRVRIDTGFGVLSRHDKRTF